VDRRVAAPGGGVSVVVPVFNSGATLPLLVAALEEHLAALADVEHHEIVLVDDGSVDDSWKVIRALADEHPEVRGLRLAYNAGEQSATLCGIAAARHDTIVTMDDDLQHGPASVADLLGALTDEVELVYGVPDRDRHHLGRRVAAGVTKPVLEHVFAVRGAGTASAFRAFRTELRERFPAVPGPLASVDGLLGNATTSVATVVVAHHHRRAGRSQYTAAKLMGHTMSVVVGGSPAPLRFATLCGFACLALGASGLVGVVLAALFGAIAQPVAWLLVATATVLFGILFVALGLLGEIGVRILQRAGGQPTYVVRDATEPDA
jgi:Glycosyl transferase family 2